MKFLVDAQLPPALAGWLRERGHEAAHVADYDMVAATDAEIAALVIEADAILVTKDVDFTFLRPPDRFALLWLRCGNASKPVLRRWIEPRLPLVFRLLEPASAFSKCAKLQYPA